MATEKNLKEVDSLIFSSIVSDLNTVISVCQRLKRLIFLYIGKAKRLREELEKIIARKKEAEDHLRDLKWEAKNNKKKPAKKVA